MFMYNRQKCKGFIGSIIILSLLLSLICTPVFGADTSEYSRGAIKLNPVEKYVYDQLLVEIGKIASGQRSDASITVDITSKVNKTQFTASDLGVSKLVGSDNKYLPGVKSMVINKVLNDIDTEMILNSLLRDLPYELYWFDKTLGCTQNVAAGVSGTTSQIGISSAHVDFHFIVSADYSVSGGRYTYSVNTQKTTAASKALTKAKSIVAAAKDKNDYNKLVYYKDTICAMTSYNTQVASQSNSNTKYGNDYQLVYVFDDKPETKVTCEGYSKAFKFLCDLTTFNSPNIACYLMTGTMKGGVGAGGHMWNVVRMDNGKNYMVDITNCDKDSAGYPDQLFLKGDNSGTETKYAIGTTEGTVAYYYDQDTISLFSPQERIIEKTRYPNGSHEHIFGEWTMYSSSQHRRYCLYDSSHYETGTHLWDSGKVTTQPTETKEGIKTYTCTICKGTRTEILPVLKTKIWKRLYGAGRYDTMKAIINEGFTKTGGTVVVATGEGFKDALAASGLAGLSSAPVVLTEGKKLSSQARAILSQLKPKTVYVAGGTGVVSEDVLNQIKALVGVNPKRIAGQNSAETSAKLALAGIGRWKENTAIIATNKTFKDALSVAPIAYAKKYPILLADNGKKLTDEVLDALKKIGTKQVIIVGGEGAVAKNVVSQLNSKGISVKIRLAGNNGVETSKKIAEWGINNGLSANKMGVATSQNYPDALAGAALCGYNKAVLVLADDKAMNNTTFPSRYISTIKKGYVFGGTFAVGEKTFTALEASTTVA